LFLTEDSDDEVSELTSTGKNYPTVTAESVKKFMKSVNRIRFNSLTATNSIQDQVKTKFGPKNRSRSCPQFPKIDLTCDEDDELTRSSSTTYHGSKSSTNVTIDEEATFPVVTDPGVDLQDISITSSNSTVTVCTKLETKVTHFLVDCRCIF